jgi:hypothetical protein
MLLEELSSSDDRRAGKLSFIVSLLFSLLDAAV